MSEPTTSVDIEDVLTSIRRLVSEEAHDAVLDQVKPQRSADRLVLTPALRIADAEAPSEPAEATDDSGPDVPPAEHEEVAEAPLLLNRGPSDNLSINHKISSLSAAVSRAAEEYEPEEGDMFGGLSKTPLPWAETHPNDPLSGRAEGEDASDLDGDAFEDETIDDHDNTASGSLVGLNEDMLRAMVAQIVREELQGEMGERITRNVRKLIRREINRALAIQDLA
ncbi:MAG: hypothetical protein MRY81_00420 [Donghicola eburneus]|nr:hypothetical protein [Donghicola eburneus]MCI5038127.1 hypothetical protein [Donghicola eburneus]